MKISRHRLSYFAEEILTAMLLWVVAALLCTYIKFNDLPNEVIRSVYAFPLELTKTKLYEVALIISLVLGLLTSLIRVFIYPIIIRNRSFFLSVLIGSLIAFALARVTLGWFTIWSGLPPHRFTIEGYSLVNKDLFVVLGYLVLIETVVTLSLTIKTNVGKNYFSRLVRNSYFRPKDEYRAFMFTDLENSTQLVEHMGSHVFSRFIQDCFKEFSNAAIDYGAEIYQFVGDEVVTTWNTSEKFNYSDCISMHFSFLAKLERRKKYFLKKYGFVPRFRSSMHCGNVSAALIGKYKSEIAYHGGVLNLCARLQSVCRDYNTELIVSETFFCQLKNSIYQFDPITNIELKGMATKQLVYKVSLDVH